LDTIAQNGLGQDNRPAFLWDKHTYGVHADKLALQKEKSFFDRIKRFRADPSTSTLSNPIPDYYGEKIGSVQDYRKWLKDQRAFSLKSKKDLL
jgi:import inner membrane translocase subunit TIM23